MTFADLKNESERKFVDISSETRRTYALADGRAITIEAPIALSVSQTAHYVVDAMGVKHRIPFNPASDVLTWETLPGAPDVVA